MSGLVKAKLADADDVKNTEIEVQLNPTSLRFQMTNSNEGAKSRGRQSQQYQGKSATTLTMDLVFDSADEGQTGAPKSVREKTKQVARFVLPAKKGSKQVPPRVRFAWGDFVVEGVMTSLTEDIDLFSPEGIPLRSKVSISISQQDPDFANLVVGSGANKGTNASAPGGNSAGPGSRAGGGADRTALALGGESAAEFAARVGLDPAAWRGIAAGLEGSLSLEAGAQIDFSADLSVAGGIGTSIGFEAGLSASLDIGIDVEVGGATSASANAGGAAPTGFALSAAGGVAAAVATATTARADRAAATAREAFALPRPAAAPTPPSRAAGPIGFSPAGRPTGAASRPADRRIARPTVDQRAASFGFGVPLRPQVHAAAAERKALIGGSPRLGARPIDPGGAVTRDPTVPPWVALPARDAGRRLADRTQADRRPTRCGCVARRVGGNRCGACGGVR